MEGLKNQMERFKLLQDEFDKEEHEMLMIREKTKELERKIYENKYVNQISSLNEENRKLLLDVQILSHQCDSLATNNNNNINNLNQNRLVQYNPYGHGGTKYYVVNNVMMVQQSPLHQQQPFINIPDKQLPSGLSFLLQPPRNIMRDYNDNNDILSRRLPHTSQIEASLQPCKLISSNSNDNICNSDNNMNNHSNNQKSPPLPPRPNRQQFSSRSPPPLPPLRTNKLLDGSHSSLNNLIDFDSQNNHQNNKWRCAHCTFENSGSLNKCEMCEFVRLAPPLDKIIIKNNLNSLHELKKERKNSLPSPAAAASSSSSSSTPISPITNRCKKWNKRH